MASLSNIVTIAISIADRAVDQASFGIPLVLGPTQVFPELVRTYAADTALASMVTDGFTTSDPEYRAVAALLAAPTQRPPTIKVGRRASGNVPTQDIQFTPISVVEGKVYTITINGTAFSATADSAPTATEIATALHTAINAGSEPMTSTDNTGSINVADDVAGAANDIYVSAGDFTVDDQTSDANVATELAAIDAVDSTWYGLVLASNSEAEAVAAAAWAETNKRQFVAVSMSTDLYEAGSSDMASTLETSSYNYTLSMYHQRPGSFPGAAWMGQQFAQDPGASTWKFDTLNGIAVSPLTETQIANLDGKTCNYYVDFGGLGLTAEGYGTSGRFADITRFVDWLAARMQEEVVNALANLPKVPYEDAGISLIAGAMQSVLEQGVDVGGLSNSPRPVVTPPLKSAILAGQITVRNLPDMKFSGVLAGAIHKVALSGTLTLS